VRQPVCAQWEAPFALDVGRTLSVHRHGRSDPTLRSAADGAIWRTCQTPDGAGTLRIAAAPESPPAGPVVVLAAAWGPGSRWLLESLPELLGARDDPSGFAPVHPRLREIAGSLPGLRVGRSLRVFEALVPAVLEQKVPGAEAFRAWRWLLGRYGEPAPGPAPPGMRVIPPPRVWASIPSWHWHRAGVEAVRARTVASAARVAGRLEEVAALAPAEADRRLRTIPGIGGWTSAEIRQRACGDADAVSVGDYNLPAIVGWTLAGRRTDDAGMLELLAPYAGHRYRVTRLVELRGSAPPRRGPRLPLRDYRAI
jgi:3-methyladenine DNA glycosylase/8-oxoguanine DNA glycosylase